MPLTFPIQLFNPSSVKYGLTGRTISSPPSLSGVTQVLRTDGGGYWTVTLSGIVLRTEDQVRAWNAWDATLQGGVTRVNVPIASVRYAPRGQAGRKAIGVGNLRDTTDDPYFPEAVAYGNPVVIAKTAGASALRATTMSLTIVQGGMIKGGEAFSIDHATMGRRLYTIARVLSRTGTTASVMISPPLREGVGSGVSVDFDWPSFEAVLVPEVDLAPELFNGRADVSISFREAF